MSADSPDRLLLELESQVAAEAEGMLAAAREEACRVRAESAARVAAVRAAALEACVDESAAGHAAALAAARLDALRRVLEAQHEAVRRVLEAVPRQAAALSAAAAPSRSIVESRLAVVLDYLGDEGAELRCAPWLHESIAAVLGERKESTVRVCPEQSIVAGVRATTTGGRVVVDDTLDGWLASERPRLSIDICRALSRPAAGEATKEPS